MPLVVLTLAFVTALHAEVIDRIAVSIDNQVITTSAIEERVRVAAFLNESPVDLSAANRRRMAERLIEQTLVQREMEVSRYPSATPEEVQAMLDQLKQRRASSAFEQKLAACGITEAALRQNLKVQATTVRFVDLRFRPGNAVSEGEVEIYYRETFVPEWQRQNPGRAAPELDDVRDRIEQILGMQKANQSLEEWLRDARSRARVRYFEEAFQ